MPEVTNARQLTDAGDLLAEALTEILDVYEIDARLGKTLGNKALKKWGQLRTQLAQMTNEDRKPGDLPCLATGGAHDATATPSRWFNRCAKCGEAWPD
jgi:hypothetical protein